MRADIVLFSGRIVKHSREPNGSLLATPTPGYHAFTSDEWRDYQAITALMKLQGVKLPGVMYGWVN